MNRSAMTWVIAQHTRGAEEARRRSCSLPDKIQDVVILAHQHALTPVFGYLVPVFALGLVLAFVLPEKKLADDNDNDPDTTPAAQSGETEPDNTEVSAPTGQ